MNHTPRERLYQLLPAIYRIRDSEQGEPLRALLGIIEQELAVLEADIDGLYEDSFIETCSEWVVPYIGDLFGVRPLYSASPNYSLRTYVANTLAYRRRKGTATVVEQLARDITGWPVRAVEFFQLLATAQHLNHLRPENVGSPDLRNANQLDLVNGPFDTVPHTAEVRRIATDGGRYNIPNLGIFLWRLQSYPIERITARSAKDAPKRCRTFSPLGYNLPLFNKPKTETPITHLADETNVPSPLRRRPLYEELEALRSALANQVDPPDAHYFGIEPVLAVFLDGTPVKPEEMLICNLDPWKLPPDKKSYLRRTPDGKPKQIDFPIRVGVDPTLGRLAFPASRPPRPVEVSYAYGFSGDLGGGPYSRQDPALDEWRKEAVWQRGVSKNKVPVADESVFTTLRDAIQAWNDWSSDNPGKRGLIVIMDSATYREDLTGDYEIRLPEGSRLLLIAAKWPVTAAEAARRIPGQFVAEDFRPHLLGDVSVVGTAPGSSANPGQLVLNGLLIEGALSVLAGNLGRFTLSHCTLVPSAGGMEVHASKDRARQNSGLSIVLERCISGPLTLCRNIPELLVSESVVDVMDSTEGSAESIMAPGSAVNVQASTLLGSLVAKTLEASNSIFVGQVTVVRRQSGCARFSYVPLSSTTPRRYRCQPEHAFKQLAEEKGYASVDELSDSDRVLVTSRLHPVFTSRGYGDPGYAQLGRNCAVEIRTGAADGSEMGVFHHLQQSQREANLQVALDEYLPVGLEAAALFVT